MTGAGGMGDQEREWPAVHGLRTCGSAAYWWEDSAAGSRLMCGPAAGQPYPVPLANNRDGLEVLVAYPGPRSGTSEGAVGRLTASQQSLPTLAGRPGGDYGYLTEESSRDAVLAWRPTVVWLGSGVATDRFVYTGFPVGTSLDHPPANGLRVAMHRVGSPFAADRAVLPDFPADCLVSLEATADPGMVLVKVARDGGVKYLLLRPESSSASGFCSVPLRVRADGRTKIALGQGRWWRGEALGTSRAAIYATAPGSFDAGDAVRLDLPKGMSIAYFWATRRRIIVRAIAGPAEQLLAVDNATLSHRVIAGGCARSAFPEIAASAGDDCAAWVRVAAEGPETTGLVEVLDDDATRPRRLRRLSWQRGLAAVRYSYRGHDGARLPLQVSGTARTVVLLEHGGLTAMTNAPLERELEHMAAAGQISVARAVTRSLVPAHRVPDGGRGYNDLLAAAEWLHAQDASGRDLIILGHSMGAVGAARAVLLRPGLFRAAVLRFPVTDLVDFPRLGIGRHWIPMLGDPAVPAHRHALREVSPLHMPLPAAPLPEVLIQVGRYDTRADPRHGRRLAERLRGAARVTCTEYSVGHVERFAHPESRRAVREAVDFLRGYAMRENDFRKGAVI